MKNKFLIFTEYHARLFKDMIIKSDNPVLYIDRGWVRYPLIKKVLGRIRFEEHAHHNFFADNLSSSCNMIFPLYFSNAIYKGSKPFHHDAYSKMNGVDAILKGQKSNSANLVLMHEINYRNDLNYKPLADLVLCRTKEEAELYSSNNSRFVGDTSLDRIVPTSHAKGVGLFLTYDKFRMGYIDNALDEILEDIKKGYRDKKLKGPLYVKDHPSSKTKKYESKLHNLKDIKFIIIDDKSSIFDLAPKINYAFVQNSLSTHYTISRLGVDSMYYNCEDQADKEFQFLSAIGAEDQKYLNRMSKLDYDQWMKETFLLDGKTSDRAIDSIRNLL